MRKGKWDNLVGQLRKAALRHEHGETSAGTAHGHRGYGPSRLRAPRCAGILDRPEAEV